MGQRNCRESWDLPPSTSPRIICRRVCKNPDAVHYYQKNSKNIQEFLKWARDEFDPQQYSSKISNREALRIEIKKKCTDKLDEEWVKFAFYPKKDEKSYRFCMYASMVDAAEANLKIEEYGQDMTTPEDGQDMTTP